MTWEIASRDAEWSVPLIITATLSEPIVYMQDHMHLDGILAAAAYRELDERTRRRIPPLSSEWVVDIDVPLARWRVPVDRDSFDERLLWRRPGRRGAGSREPYLWGWCASAERATWLRHGIAEVRKRPEIGQMARYTTSAKANTAAGVLKAFDLPFPTVVAHTITWYALGDAERVKHLLERIDAIGKKRNHGWGTVSSWSVARCEVDRSVADENGGTMRRMPAESDLEGTRCYGSIRPPYHHRSRVVSAVEPLS